jgi:hypothetical protein
MPEIQREGLAVLLSIAAFLTLSGCEGCGTARHARAQAADGGVAPYQPGPSYVASCFVLASRSTGLTDRQIGALCLGAPTPNGPVDCYLAAHHSLGVADAQVIDLCRCSSSSEPIACYRRLRTEAALTDDQIAFLCAPTQTLGLLANCRPIGGFY